MAEDRDDRPDGDDGERQERGDRGDERRQDVERLVDDGGDEVFLEHQLHAVGEALKQPEGTDPVGSRTLLHAAEDSPLRPDLQQCRHQQEHEDGDSLEEDEPPGVETESVEVGAPGRRGYDAHDCAPPALIRTTSPAAAAKAVRTCESGECVGSQTTPSAMSAVIVRGRVIAPRSVRTLTGDPSAAPISFAVVGDSRSTAGLRVRAKKRSPSCSLPSSSSRCQVASTAEPVPGDVTVPTACWWSAGRAQSQ